MSGLLRRLARHAVNPTTSTVHAMSGLPYIPAPNLRTVENAAGRVPVAESAQPAMPAPGSPSDPPSTSPMMPITQASPAQTAAKLLSEPATVVPTTPSSSTDIVPAPLMPELSDENRTMPASSQTDTSSAVATADTIRVANRTTTSDNRRTIDTQPQHAQPGHVSRHTAPRSMPDALLASIATPVTSPTSTDQQAATGPLETAIKTDLAVEAPTEVHVHIGRIEVTAVRDVTPQKPAAHNERQPMSLDDYLAQRQPRGS